MHILAINSLSVVGLWWGEGAYVAGGTSGNLSHSRLAVAVGEIVGALGGPPALMACQSGR